MDFLKILMFCVIFSFYSSRILAGSANNEFVTVSAGCTVKAVNATDFCLTNSSATEIVVDVSAQPGWILLSSPSVTLYAPESTNWMVKCEMGEDMMSGLIDFPAKLTITCKEWVGINCTDAGPSNQFITAVATRDPSEESATCKWTNLSIAEGKEVEGDALKYELTVCGKENASSSYQSEIIKATSGCLSAMTNFTIVKVDVTIGDCTEENEETDGTFVACTNDVKDVAMPVFFVCEPANLPSNEVVEIDFKSDTCELLEEENPGSFVPLKASYRASELASKNFKLRGIKPSNGLRDTTITIKHEKSGAIDRAKATVVKAVLVSVSFKNGATLFSDFGVKYTMPQYENTDTGVAIRAYPISYIRGTNIVLDATFTIAPQIPGEKICIKGTCDIFGGIAPTNAIVSGNNAQLSNVIGSKPLANNIDCVKPMKIDWFASIDSGRNWILAGSSTNTLYVTWAKPVAKDNIETYFDVGCEVAKGQTGIFGFNDDQVLDKIWAKFQTKRISRVSDGRLLTYYGFSDKNGNGTWDAGCDEDSNSPDVNTVVFANELTAIP